MFNFWYRFVFGNTELIEQRKADYMYTTEIAPFLSDYLGATFEEISIQYLRKYNGTDKLPFIFTSIGRWWGNNPFKKCEEEIDIVCKNNENILLGECKWRNEPISIAVVNGLIEKSAIFKEANKHYIFFSKSGYKEEVINYCKSRSDIILVSLEDFK